MACEEELAPLDEVIPSNLEERKRWLFDIKTRPANFDVDWNAEDDSRLLCGIYQYGIGSWEAMKMDPTLSLSEKILSNDSSKKPQGKHLQSRAEYLLKIIRKNLELTKGMNKNKGKAKKPRKIKQEKGVKSKDIIENDANSSADDVKIKKEPISTAPIPENNNSNDKPNVLHAHTPLTNNQNHHSNQTAVGHHDDASNGPTTKENNKNSTKKSKANKEQKKSKKKADGPMHFTANNEPRALDVLGDLDPTIFNECKEKMRPVKKALKALDNPDQSLSNEDQIKQARDCLISIGRQIDVCLAQYKDPDQFKEWQSNLWYFVSKFTEYDAKKLFKMYKQANKKLEGGAGNDKTSPSTSSSKHTKDTPSKHNDQKMANSEQRSKDKSIDEKRERKEKKKMQRERERREKEDRHRHDDDNSNSLDNGTGSHQNRDDSIKRRLEEGEIEPDATGRLYKQQRIHGDNR